MEVSANFQEEEKKAGSIARAALKASYLTQIRSTFNRRSGDLEKSNFSARYRGGFLDRLVLNSPHYSFKEHFGSSKTGAQKESTRSASNVKTFSRHINGETVQVRAHTRSGGSVKAFNKRREYTAKNHISRALSQTNALDVLATSLGENRIVLISSQISF
nr:hypothetical protein [uncultured Flavobacterium sp.]